MGRAEWAVTAAQHTLSTLRILDEASGVEVDLARQKAGDLYFSLLFSVGTVPMNRLEDLYEITVGAGLGVLQALDEIGA